MKSLSKLLGAALLAVALITQPGCSTFQNTSAKVLVSTVQTVDTAMQGWATYVVLNNVPDAEQATVRNAYASYQLAERAAEAAYFASLNTGDKSQWERAAESLRASQTVLMALITQLTRKN